MLEIPIRVGVSKEQADKAIEDFANNVRDSLDDIIGPGGYNLSVNVDFKSSGVREVSSELAKAKTGAEGYEAGIRKMARTQEGSLTSLRQSVNSLKQQRDALERTSAGWKEYDDRLRATAASLRAQQGIQVGSLTDLRRQRDELLKLRDATARFPSGPTGAGGGPTWDDLNRQIKALDGSINKVTPGFSQFFSVLSRVATVQAGFIAITSAIGALGGVINAYVGRTKQVEAFNLALKNVGLTQAETTATFQEAAATASRLGAPVQQVEKSYQRMVPALRAVGADSAKTAKFIENITARTQTLGLNTEQSGRLLEAFAQVLSKGKLQAEELNQQISELDGAFRSQLADALGVTTEQLTELVEQGAITAPVFIDAINRMSNGVEELERRVRTGNETIQQLQNLIAGINIKILEEIGKQIEPGVRAFLRLSLAVADFFREFTKTETFASLTTIFNQIAKGLEVFVNNLLSAVKATESLLSPIFGLIGSVLGLGEEFGGLIGITINLVGGLLVLKGILAGFSVLSSITKNVKSFGQEMFIAGKGVNYLSDTAKASSFASIRQGFENLRAVSVGLSEKIKQMVSGFLGLDAAFKKSGSAAKATSSQFTQLQLSLGNTATQAQKVKPNIDSIALSIGTRFANSINGAADRLGLFINKLRGITPQTQQLSLALDQVGYKADNLSTKFLNFASKAGSALKQIAASFSELALTAAIGGVIAAIERGVNVNKAAEQATKAYAEANNVGAVRLKQFLEEQKKVTSSTAKAGNQTAQSYKQSSNAINQYSGAQKAAAGGNIALGVGFTTAAVGATAFAAKLVIAAAALAAVVGTGGAAAPVIAGIAAKGFLVASAAAAAAAVAVNRFSEASKNLEKSAGGKNFLNSIKEQDKATQAAIKTVEGLGAKIGQTDFSSFAKGSVSLQRLKETYDQIIASSNEYIEAKRAEVRAAEEQLASAKDTGEVERLKGIISIGKDQIKNYEALRDAAALSAEAIKEENAAKIASGSASDLAKASAEELTAAIKLQANAIESSALEARTEALKKYGQTQAQAGQLEATNLGIELGAINQRLAGYQRILDALNKRKAEGKALSAEEKKLASELTRTIAEETLKQTEIQKQLGDAIVAGFERGMQKARELAGVYGQVASQAKSQFDGISGAVTSGLSAALSLVDAVAAKELEGVEQGSLLRKKIIIEQLRAAAIANQAEADIAQIKLAVQNKIAQNEAKNAQIRYETEARLAQLRGETDLAQVYRDAAGAQGQIIQGLQTQYQIESKAIDLQRQAKDQQLIQKGLSEGIGKNSREAASWIGVQNVNLKQASAELNSMVKDGKSLVNSYGQAATSASNIQTEAEGTQMSRAEQEAESVKAAFDEAKGSVGGMNDELSQTPDLITSIDASFKALNSSIGETKRAIEDIDKVLKGSGGGQFAGTNVTGRATGGPVSAGTQYLVNDGGGREGFLNRFGNFSMLPAGRNIHWTAPTSGTVIPAHLVDRYKRAADLNKQINATSVATTLNTSRGNTMSSSVDSGNLIQRVASAMSGSGGTQRITNNVTIQSQEPVTDASKIMTNVARMRLRNARRG